MEAQYSGKPSTRQKKRQVTNFDAKTQKRRESAENRLHFFGVCSKLVNCRGMNGGEVPLL